MPISISIVEDEVRTRETLIALLNCKPGFRCVNTYADAETALLGIPRDKPDVALVDICLPGMSGIDCVVRLRRYLPQLPVLMLTTYEDADLIFQSSRAGAKGYVLKKVPPDELVTAIEQLHAGGAPMSMQIARKVVDYFDRLPLAASEQESLETLSEREYEVLTLLARGFHYKEISVHLNISIHTVRTHLHHIYEKLHVSSRTEAAMKYFQGEQQRR